MNIAAIVPSLNPDEKFRTVIESLIEAGFTRIYVVNDGSSKEYDCYFEEAAAHKECTLLVHPVNQGKGRALKTAFERYLAEADDMLGVVTLDGDGQHSAEDCIRIAQELQAHPDALVLGVRDFSQSHVPAKSALGNKITRTIFRIACGIPITDTQTGLRAIPNTFIRRLLDVKGERYEFETNMLLETKRSQVSVREVPISTIYIDNNAASHFHPLRDAFRIYALILKFMLASILSFLVDYGLFNLLYYVLFTGIAATHRVLWATVCARVCSALFNFSVNRTLVFDSKAKAGGALLRYAIVCVVQLLASFGAVYLLSEVLPVPAWLAKIVADIVLFFISFFVQRRWVFRSTQH